MATEIRIRLTQDLPLDSRNGCFKGKVYKVIEVKNNIAFFKADQWPFHKCGAHPHECEQVKEEKNK